MSRSVTLECGFVDLPRWNYTKQQIRHSRQYWYALMGLRVGTSTNSSPACTAPTGKIKAELGVVDLQLHTTASTNALKIFTVQLAL